MDDDIDPAQRGPKELPIANRADVGRERRLETIETDGVMTALPQRPDETFTQMAGTSRHEHAHGCIYTTSREPNC